MRQKMLNQAFLRITRETALDEQSGRCFYCRDRLTKRSVTADHVRPKIEWGSDKRENIVAACKPCNSLRGSMSTKLFASLITEPPSGRSINYHLAWARLRINKRLELMERRVMRAVGRKAAS